MPRGRPRSSSKSLHGVRGRQPMKVIDRKPIRPLERQRMRPWLINLLDEEKCDQLAWFSKKDKTFKVSWKHAAGQTFDPEADASLFELWARHTGKFYPGDKADPKKWKANFRCALHSLQDVDEDKSLGVKKGCNAYRVYRLLDEKKIKKPRVAERECRSPVSDSDDIDAEEDFLRFRNKGTMSRPRKQDDLDSNGSENGYSPSHDSSHSDWEMETRGQEETEAEKSPLPNFEQLCETSFQLSATRKQAETPRVPETITLHYVDQPANLYNLAQTDNLYASGEVISVDEDQYYEINFADVEEMGHLYQFENDNELCLKEEIVSSVAGPSVIVIEEQGDCEYQSYTSLDNL